MKPGFTLADERNPARRIERLRERQQHLRDEIVIKEDQIAIMEHEIGEVRE
ncbi:MAG: hypothetical protein NTW33_10290 [Methanoregula sp.]|nr:hypothetical protein [Methanoregula sp.]